MSFDPYAFSKMDPENSNEPESTNTESLTSTLKGMLKINGNATEASASAPEEETPSKQEEASEEESKKDSVDEEPSIHTDTEGGDAQRIDLSQASDGECIPIYGSDVTIVTSPSSDMASKSSGSNKVRIKPITKFEWTHKYYDGDLVSVTNNYMAYAIKSRAFAVRVISRKNSSDRLLLRGFSAPVCDVSFAHPTSSLVSAVDEDGNFLVWQLSLNGDSTTAIKKLHVKPTFNDSTYHRLVWLTFMHCDVDGPNAEELLQLDPEDEPDPASHKRLLAVSHGRTVEVWDVNAAFEIAVNDKEHTEKDKLAATYMTIQHDDVVSDCVLSPEGSVIAIASHDGFVKFWQVSIENTDEPTCLHKWKPHGDQPVSLVTFCDDRTQAQLVLYWRFMLTGCKQNNELKIWCTVSWSCLQTICFEPSPGSLTLPAMKCVLHAAADYLVIADINRKVVYVMQCATDLENGKASLSSISQYLLTKSLLSFEVVEAYKCKFKNLIAMDEEGVDREDQDDVSQASDDEKDDDDETDEASAANELLKKTNGVLIKLISVTSKSLESLDIRFVPRIQTDESLSYSTYNTISDDLNVMSVDESLSIVSPSLENGQSHDEELEQARREIEEEDEEADSTKNKTALTANEGDQSTILVMNEEETQNAEKDDDPVTPERPPRLLTPIDGSLRTSVMDLLDTDEPPIAHSSPSVAFIPDESQNRGQGEGEAATSPDKPEPHPVLLTPEAFTSSLRNPEDLLSVDSSFTRVTPFSADHPSLFESERDKSVQDSVRAKSPASPPSLNPPPGFPPISTTTVIYKPDTGRDAMSLPGQPNTARSSLDIETDVHSLPPILQPAATRSSLDIAPPAQSYHPILQSISASEPGPFGDIQSTLPSTKDQSPDLISSASSIENAGPDARVLIGGPLLGAVGGSGDSLFLSAQAKTGNDMDAQSDVSNSSKKSDRLPVLPPSAPWPKAPDVTMSRPMTKKPTQPHTREEFLRTSEMSQQSQMPPDAIPNADIASGDHLRSKIGPNLAADILSAISNLQKQQEDAQKSMQKEFTKKINQIGKSIDTTQRRFEQQQNDKLDRALKNMVDSQKKFQSENRAYSVASTEQAAGRIDKAIKHEMRNTVLPNLSKTLDPLKDQLHSTLAQKLTATDSLLRESMGKLVRSKETLDVIGGAAGRAVQSHVHSAYKDSFSQVVIPAFEKQCNLMFQQISVTFQRGVDDAVAKLEKQLQSRVKSEVDRVSLMEKQAREATSELSNTASHLHSKITASIEQEVQKLVRTEMKRVQESMSSEISKTFKRQHEAALKEQKAVLTECIQNAMAEFQPQQAQGQPKSSGGKSPHPGTPGRSPGPIRQTFEMQQRVILNHLHQGNINAAFQRALTASDLTLVMYVCEMVDPAVVFGTTPCPLNQPIILSLIQQLSCDLGRNTMTKLRYLQEAVMNLDSSHQVTQEHMHSVLDALVKSLDGHVATLTSQPTDASNTPIIKQMKMLSMAARSLIQ